MQLNQLINKQLMILCLMLSTAIAAQDFNIKAYYKSFKKTGVSLDSTKYDKETITKIQDIFSKQFQKTYILKVKNTESVFREEESLSNTQTLNIIYTDKSSDKFVNKYEFLNKYFLVSDSIPKFEWQITSETKSIGKYNCNKALATVPKGTLLIDHITDKETKIQAWFTSEIPVNHGPSIYNGLPGLILEINDGTYNLLCTKIQFSKEEVKIKEPKGGKQVNHKAFAKIIEQKLKDGRQKSMEFRKGIEAEKND